MVNLNETTDSFDGNKPTRQITITLTHVSIISVIIIMVMLFFGTSFIVSALLATPLVVFYLLNGIVSPSQDAIRATDNIFAQTIFIDGGTKYIIYQRLGWKYVWERDQGFEVNIENQDPLGSRELTVTIGDIALEMKIKGMWRVFLPRLSMFIQNKKNLDVTLNQMKAFMCQTLEEYCSLTFRDDGDTFGVDLVRQSQSQIAQYVLDQVNKEYLCEGIQLTRINFERCDYSKETQVQLNQLIELRAIKKIASSVSGTDDPLEAFRLAAAAAGKKGVTVSKEEQVRTVIMDPKVAEAIAKMGVGGAIAAGLLDASHGKSS